MLSVLFVGLLI